MTFHNQLEHLSLSSLLMHILCLRVSLEPTQ